MSNFIMDSKSENQVTDINYSFNPTYIFLLDENNYLFLTNDAKRIFVKYSRYKDEKQEYTKLRIKSLYNSIYIIK